MSHLLTRANVVAGWPQATSILSSGSGATKAPGDLIDRVVPHGVVHSHLVDINPAHVATCNALGSLTLACLGVANHFLQGSVVSVL